MFAVAGAAMTLAAGGTSVGWRAPDAADALTIEVTTFGASAETFEDKVSATRAWFVALISPSEMPTAILPSLVASPTTRATITAARPRGGGAVKMPLTFALVNLWKTDKVP